jgi:fructokinase
MTKKRLIAGLGEILWDVFPDGPRFGGAPANFACSASGIGADTVHACIVSAVGTDELGLNALEELRIRQVNVSQTQQVDSPTGQVLVQLNDAGQASYEFAADTAWDNMAWSDELKQFAGTLDAVCFGTLGQRCDVSRQTIRRLVVATKESCLRILDINLRAPFWNEATILESLPLANVLKLNTDELPIVSSILSISGSDEALLNQLLKKFAYRAVALTRGAEGSILLNCSGEYSELPGKPTMVVDTVGAGDAFTAAMTVGLLQDRPIAAVHAWAAEVAAYVCTQPGATPEMPLHLQVANN